MRNPDLQQLQGLLNYQFRDPALLLTALSHRSVGADNNERLEFLGDAVLGQVIAAELYHRFDTLDEGGLSRLRSTLVREDALYRVADALNLQDFIRLGQGERKSGGRHRKSILSDTVEALIGAIFLDAGMETATRWVLASFASQLQLVEPEQVSKDAKTRLQELLQSRGFAVPDYHLLSTEGKDHEKQFLVQCSCEMDVPAATAKARSRRKAEQAAAAMMLQQLEALDG